MRALHTKWLIPAIVVSACAINTKIGIVTPLGGEITIDVKMTVGGLPPGAMPLALTGQYDGKTWQLYDGDGDGKGEYAKEEGGTTVVTIVPIDPADYQEASAVVPGGGGSLSVRPKAQVRPLFEPYVKPPQEPIDYEAEQSEQELLAEHGLEDLEPGPNVLGGGVVEPNAVQLELDATGAITGAWLDVTVNWNGAYAWPSDIQDYPHVGYNFHNISDAEGIGAYWFLQVDGEAEYVLKWLSDFGFEDLVFLDVTTQASGDDPPNEIGTVAIQIEQDLGVAFVSVESVPVTTIPLLQD